MMEGKFRPKAVAFSVSVIVLAKAPSRLMSFSLDCTTGLCVTPVPHECDIQANSRLNIYAGNGNKSCRERISVTREPKIGPSL